LIVEIEGTAVLATVTDGDPPSLMLKIPLRGGAPADVPDDFVPEGLKETIELSIEGRDAWLTIRRLVAIDAETLSGIVERSLELLKERELLPAAGCFDCGTTHETKIVYEPGEIARLCTSCIGARVDRAREAHSEALRGSAPFLLVIPFSMLLGAAVWGGAWYVYERYSSQYAIENVIAGLVATLAGVVVANAVARSTLGQLLPARIAALVLVGVTIVLGETLVMTLLVHDRAGILDPVFGFRVMLWNMAETPGAYLLARLVGLLLAFAVAWGTVPPMRTRLSRG
jgi:hypothetical protein